MLSSRFTCKFNTYCPREARPKVSSSLLGPLAQSQSHAFSTALLFAQDYGILAASAEDRPFIPVSTVVLEGVPKDMRAVFRRWDDNAGIGGAASLMAGRLGRGKSLRVVGLGRALSMTGR